MACGSLIEDLEDGTRIDLRPHVATAGTFDRPWSMSAPVTWTTVLAAGSVFAASLAVTLAAVAVVDAARQRHEEEHAPPMVVAPDADATFAHDFSAEDARIPEGAVPETRDLRLGDDAAPEHRGLIETVNGYVLPSGAFKRHGGWTIWWDEAKTVEAVVGGARHGRTHGPTLAFFPDGRRAAEETWVHGIRHGVSRTWDQSAVCRSVERFFDGKLEGQSESWYAGGQKKTETNWCEGREHGIARTWREDGTLESAAEYAEGVRQDRYADAATRR